MKSQPSPPLNTNPGPRDDESTQRLGELNAMLEFTNLELRRDLMGRDRMQAILLSTLQSLTVGVLAVGHDGIVILVNPAACQLLDRTLGETAGRRIEDVIDAIPGASLLIQTLGGPEGGQLRLTWNPERPGESAGHIEIRALRNLPPWDNHLAGLILLEDQTRLRRLEAQAHLKSRLTGMGEVATNLAHEIRNPLGSIELFASTLERELDGNQSLQPLAAQIVSGVRSLNHLVVNMLEFARPRRMAMSRVDLAAVIKDALIYVNHPLQQKAIEVDYDCDLQPGVRIAGDAEQLRQVFLNLFINAIQAMDDHGRLSVEIKGRPHQGWSVAVRDTGSGIAPQALPRIFDPFFTSRDKGSGLGLAIVHAILAAHRAEIEVESDVGLGTTFWITFPDQNAFEYALHD